MFVTVHFSCTYQWDSLKQLCHFPHDPLISSLSSLLGVFLSAFVALPLNVNKSPSLSVFACCLSMLVGRNSHRWRFGTFKILIDATFFLPCQGSDDRVRRARSSDFSVIWAGKNCCKQSKNLNLTGKVKFVNSSEVSIQINFCEIGPVKLQFESSKKLSKR